MQLRTKGKGLKALRRSSPPPVRAGTLPSPPRGRGKRRHNSGAYKSGFEKEFARVTKEAGWDLEYEKDKIKYIIPAKQHTYTPDFTVTKNVYIETKGQWVIQDRKKALLIRDQHPEKKILYVFYRNQKLSKKSTTTYMEWASKNGLPCCLFSDTLIWQEWIDENY